VLDAPHGRAEDEPLVPQLLGHPHRHELRPAHEAVLLGAALGVEQEFEAARRVDVEERVQQGDLLGLGRPDGLDTQLEQHSPRPGGEVAAHPRGQALAVELRRVWCLPGRVPGDAVRKPVEPPLGTLDVEQDDGVDARDAAPVTAQRAAVLDQVVALAIRAEGLDAELRGQGREPVLCRADPLPAHLDDLAVAQPMVEHAAADSLARLHDEDRDVA